MPILGRCHCHPRRIYQVHGILPSHDVPRFENNSSTCACGFMNNNHINITQLKITDTSCKNKFELLITQCWYFWQYTCPRIESPIPALFKPSILISALMHDGRGACLVKLNLASSCKQRQNKLVQTQLKYSNSIFLFELSTVTFIKAKQNYMNERACTMIESSCIMIESSCITNSIHHF